MRSANRSAQPRNRSRTSLRSRSVELRETPKNSVNSQNTFAVHQAFAEKIAQRAVLIAAIIAAAIVFYFILKAFGVLDPVKLRAFVESTGPWAPLVTMTIIAIGSISLTLPGTPAIVLSGALFGPYLGALYSFIGILAGASIAFFIARFFRSIIIRLLGKHAEILVRFQHRYVGWVIFFTRAVPIFSFEIISYAAGLTGISYGAYILATSLGIILPTIFLTRSGSFILEGSGFIPVTAASILILLLFLVPRAIEHYNPFGWKEKLLKNKKGEKK